MPETIADHIVTLDPADSVWDRAFIVAPLVLIGSREADGGYDLAPKHMVMPVSWENFLGFVCTPRHRTYGNVAREGTFTASFLRPAQILQASFAAAPRCDDEAKPSLAAIGTFPATRIDGRFASDGYLYLECELDRVVDDLGENSLIIGRVVTAHVHEDSLRRSDRDDQDLIHAAPILAYLHPGRFASIDSSRSFPFPTGMKK